jgi:ABC-type dipeptide/oligopeptide/nickel transport system permease component
LGSYVARRVIQALFTLIFALFLIHVMSTLAIQVNGNPALAFFGDHVPTEQQVAAVEERYNLDDPCFDQVGNPCIGPFFERLQSYATGDFGTNLRGNQEVTEMLTLAVPNTLRLFTVVVITWLIVGLTFGSLAARFRGKAPDTSIRSFSIFVDAFPVFVALLVYVYIVAVPMSNWARDTFGDGSIPHLLFQPQFKQDNPWLTVIVPGILLGAAGAASFIRLVRAAQLENYNADHVRTARSKGLGEFRVTAFHIMRNSAIPVVTAIGLEFTEATAGAVITEGLMNIKGVGGLLWSSVGNSEVSIVLALITIIAIAILVINLLVDLAYAVLDPRIRYE